MIVWAGKTWISNYCREGGGVGQMGLSIPIPIPLYNGSWLFFISIAKVYAILQGKVNEP